MSGRTVAPGGLTDVARDRIAGAFSFAGFTSCARARSMTATIHAPGGGHASIGTITSAIAES